MNVGSTSTASIVFNMVAVVSYKGKSINFFDAVTRPHVKVCSVQSILHWHAADVDGYFTW